MSPCNYLEVTQNREDRKTGLRWEAAPSGESRLMSVNVPLVFVAKTCESPGAHAPGGPLWKSAMDMVLCFSRSNAVGVQHEDGNNISTESSRHTEAPCRFAPAPSYMYLL